MKNTKNYLSVIRQSVLVKDVMSKDIICMDENKSVYDAVKLMSEKSISTVVISSRGKPMAVVTERDMVKKILLGNKNTKKTKLKEIMTIHPKTITPETPILRAGEIMKEQKVRKLIVVDKDDNYIGLISQTDIINSLNRIYESYRFLLGNPIVSVIMILVIVLLVLLTIFLKF